MAHKSTVYRATIELADTDRGLYTTLEARVAQHPSETAQRLVARLLAYGLCYEEGLEFTRGICEGDTPDLWIRDPDEKINHWIEVGLPDPARITKACKQSRQVSLFLYGNQRRRWEGMHLTNLMPISNLTLYGLEPSLMDNLAHNMTRNIHWSVTRSEAILYVTTGDRSYESELAILKGSDVHQT
jgi:uncharacterized protein YaeQ